MPMAFTARRFTVSDLAAWPDDGNRYELLDGLLLVTPAPVPAHQVVAARLIVALSERVGPWPEVRVAGPGEIRLPPHTTLQPDILVFRAPSIPAKWEAVKEHWLAVEIWSPSSVIYDREVKRDAYLQLGVHEVWLVDLERHRVLVSRPGSGPDQPFDTLLPWRAPALPTPAPLNLEEVFRALD